MNGWIFSINNALIGQTQGPPTSSRRLLVVCRKEDKQAISCPRSELRSCVKAEEVVLGSPVPNKPYGFCETWSNVERKTATQHTSEWVWPTGFLAFSSKNLCLWTSSCGFAHHIKWSSKMVRFNAEWLRRWEWNAVYTPLRRPYWTIWFLWT